MAIATDDTLLQGLNPAQREAVLHFNGPMLVLAGAGSGKTRVLTTRIARLIEHHGVDPSRILAVTFTNKAAGEMKRAHRPLLGRAPVGMWIGTFHAIGARMLRAAPHLVGRTPSFTIYDQDDTQTVVKRIMERHQLNTKQFTPRGVHGAISDAKNALVYPDERTPTDAMDPFREQHRARLPRLRRGAAPRQRRGLRRPAAAARWRCSTSIRSGSPTTARASSSSWWTSTRTRTAPSTSS